MGRLTDNENYCIKTDCSACAGGVGIGCYEEKIYNKLKEYETLEEQGLLLKLPCKVGDVVYYFKTLNDGENTIVIEEFKIHMFSFTNAGLFMIDHFRHSLCVDLLNETIFLTKAEAEKALEEMEK